MYPKYHTRKPSFLSYLDWNSQSYLCVLIELLIYYCGIADILFQQLVPKFLLKEGFFAPYWQGPIWSSGLISYYFPAYQLWSHQLPCCSLEHARYFMPQGLGPSCPLSGTILPHLSKWFVPLPISSVCAKITSSLRPFLTTYLKWNILPSIFLCTLSPLFSSIALITIKYATYYTGKYNTGDNWDQTYQPTEGSTSVLKQKEK